MPKTRALFEATYFAGLREAGMPDQRFVRVTGWLGSKAEGRLARWPKSPIVATAFRR